MFCLRRFSARWEDSKWALANFVLGRFGARIRLLVLFGRGSCNDLVKDDAIVAVDNF